LAGVCRLAVTFTSLCFVSVIVGCRIGSLLLLAAPLAILAPLSYLSPKLEDIAWSYATWSVETAGPTFTKLAQWASTRADLFPAEFVGRFAKLQDATEGHSWAHTERILRQSLGDNYKDLIHLDPKPIGSGCIAQVYKGILQQPTALFPQGTELAIKVQHPNIRAKVLVDFYILHKMASFLEKLPWLNLDYLSLQDSVGQFRSIMIPQLDMTCEARNLTRFLRDFSGDDSITFPQPIHELTTEQVLVEKFMHGEKTIIYISICIYFTTNFEKQTNDKHLDNFVCTCLAGNHCTKLQENQF